MYGPLAESKSYAYIPTFFAPYFNRSSVVFI